MSTNNQLLIPVSYHLPWSRYRNGSEWQRTEVVATHFKDGLPDKWAIREMGAVLNKDGEWEYEPTPSNRDDEFLFRTRFLSPTEAADFAKTHMQPPPPGRSQP